MWFVNNLSQIFAPRNDAMDARDDGEVSKLSPGRSPRGQAVAPVSSLNKAWLHALDKCAIDTPLSETVLPLMRNCFSGGAAHAVLLLQKGHGDQLASDIASFLMEERFSSGKSGNCDDGLAFSLPVTEGRHAVRCEKRRRA
jgi:hypothetical protein